jgi:hypothetical protein
VAPLRCLFTLAKITQVDGAGICLALIDIKWRHLKLIILNPCQSKMPELYQYPVFFATEPRHRDRNGIYQVIYVAKFEAALGFVALL